jgi:6-phosphogluconate dehydrogenase
LANLILAPEISKKLIAHEDALRTVVCSAIEMGVPAPCFMTALSYLDGYRSSWLPANLIQAQRDYFGAHTYSRIDMKGTYHTEWKKR